MKVIKAKEIFCSIIKLGYLALIIGSHFFNSYLNLNKQMHCIDVTYLGSNSNIETYNFEVIYTKGK